MPITFSFSAPAGPLINKNAISFVQKVKAECFKCYMSSNGAVLTEEKTYALLDAGPVETYLNISGIHDEYE